jgi:hypothetical protein
LKCLEEISLNLLLSSQALLLFNTGGRCLNDEQDAKSHLLARSLIIWLWSTLKMDGYFPLKPCFIYGLEGAVFQEMATSVSTAVRTSHPTFRVTFSHSVKIWGFHGGDYEEWHLLGWYAVWLLQEATFRTNLFRSVRRLIVKLTFFLVHRSCQADEGGTKFLRNVGSTRATRRNIPEDAILQSFCLPQSLHLTIHASSYHPQSYEGRPYNWVARQPWIEWISTPHDLCLTARTMISRWAVAYKNSAYPASPHKSWSMKPKKRHAL